MSAFTMRAPCAKCGAAFGNLAMVGRQNTVRCVNCNTFQYNAPRVETGDAPGKVHQREMFSPGERSRVLERCGYRCFECGQRAPDVLLHVGHIISVADGREHGISDEIVNSEWNRAASCEACNLGRGSRSMTPIAALHIIAALVRIAEKALQ